MVRSHETIVVLQALKQLQIELAELRQELKAYDERLQRLELTGVRIDITELLVELMNTETDAASSTETATPTSN